jgi:hypothetical protein
VVRLAIRLRCDEQIFPHNGELPTMELVQALGERHLGEFLGTSIEWGFAEVVFAVRDPSTTIEQVKQILIDLGVANYAWTANSEDPEQDWQRVGAGR